MALASLAGLVVLLVVWDWSNTYHYAVNVQVQPTTLLRGGLNVIESKPASNNRPSNIGACNTVSSPPNINVDDPNTAPRPPIMLDIATAFPAVSGIIATGHRRGMAIRSPPRPSLAGGL